MATTGKGYIATAFLEKAYLFQDVKVFSVVLIQALFTQIY